MPTINGTFLPDILVGTSEDDIINGFGLVDIISGGDGNDIIDGGSGDDILNGDDGDDILIGGVGSATLLSFYNGGNGNDLMIASEIGIAENFDGGDGIDTVSYAARTSGVTTYLINLLGIPLLDTLHNVENVIGSTFNDEITGDDSNNRLEGSGGDDLLVGAGGNDTLIGGAGADEMQGGVGDDTYYYDEGDTIVELAGGGNDTVLITSSYTLTSGSEIENVALADPNGTTAINLTGNEFNNNLTGNEGANVIEGGGGADRMEGRGGNDLYYVDNSADQVIEAVGGGNDTVLTSASYALGAGQEVETLAARDTALSTPIALFGNEFVNVITGNAGANFLDGGAGADSLTGLGGNDVYTIDNAGDQVVEAASGGYDTIYTSFSYVIAAGNSVEVLSARDSNATDALNLFGNELDNGLIGNNGVNYLDGQAGADVMTGFGGDDVYTIDNANDVVVEEIGGGYDTIYTSFNYVLGFGASVEVLSARDSNLTTALSLFGNELDNGLIGNNGANYLDGQLGADVMTGFGGDDIYTIDNAGDVVVEELNGGNDAIYTSFSYQLGVGASVEILASRDNMATVAMDLLGNELNNVIFGNNGANYIDGAIGADDMVGFAGDDVYTVDNALDQIYDAVGGGNDTVFATTSYTLTIDREVETLAARDNNLTVAMDLTGNEFGNAVQGNNGANRLDGGGGNDVLTGFGGADTFAFTTALGGGNVDRIADFAHGTDRIALDDAVFTAIGGLGALGAGAFATGSAAGDADDRIIYNSASGALYYDADGNGAGAAVQFAMLAGGLGLSASDFMVI